MTKVRELIKTKTNVWSLEPNQTVYEAIKFMAEKEIGAILLIADDKVHGIFSERDYARKVVLSERASRTTTLSEIMTKKVLSVTSNHTVDYCMALMTEKHIRHLPVIENGKALAMLSLGDLVKSIIEEQKNTISQLETYITT